MADLLRMDYINSLGPLLVRLCGDQTRYPLEVIDVETGLLKFDVCGKLQNDHIGSVIEFFDRNGTSYNPDTFYTEYLEEESNK